MSRKDFFRDVYSSFTVTHTRTTTYFNIIIGICIFIAGFSFNALNSSESFFQSIPWFILLGGDIIMLVLIISSFLPIKKTNMKFNPFYFSSYDTYESTEKIADELYKRTRSEKKIIEQYAIELKGLSKILKRRFFKIKLCFTVLFITLLLAIASKITLLFI